MSAEQSVRTAQELADGFKAIVAEWEQGQARVATFVSRNDAHVHVVRSNTRGVYGVLRYFTIGTDWHVSADGIELDAEGVLPVLEKALA